MHQASRPALDDDRTVGIVIKFLNDTQKSIVVHSNDTILKIKRSMPTSEQQSSLRCFPFRLYFPDELSTNKIVRFIYQGRELQDDGTVGTYNLRDQTVIHCQITHRRVSSSTSSSRLDEGPSSASHFNEHGSAGMSSSVILLVSLVLGLVWSLRIKYRVLFTPLSTILLLLSTILFFIFTCAPLLVWRRSDATRHVHLEPPTSPFVH